MKIGLVPGSFKPYHKGHDELIRLASAENDLVLVYNSDADRENVSGQAMISVINKFVKPTLPKNVRMISTGIPVGALFQELQYAEESNSKDFYKIYSDDVDIKKYSKNILGKYAPTLAAKGQIETRPVKRGIESTDVSGTKMRQYLRTGDVEKFREFLPTAIKHQSSQIIDMLKSRTNENLLRHFIKLVVS